MKQKECLEDSRVVSLEDRDHPEQYSLPIFLVLLVETKEFGTYDGGNPINVGLDRINQDQIVQRQEFSHERA